MHSADPSTARQPAGKATDRRRTMHTPGTSNTHESAGGKRSRNPLGRIAILLTALLSIIAVATLPSVAHAAPSVSKGKVDLSTHFVVPKPGDIIRGHKVIRYIPFDESKATNLKSGKVNINGTALTTVTSKDCPALNASPMMSPLGVTDSKIFLSMSYHASLTTSGRPMGRMRTGNSSFVKSNHTDSYGFYFSDGIWFDFYYNNNRGGNWYGWAHAPSLDKGGPFFLKYGTRNQVGINVQTNGYPASPWVQPPGGLGGNHLLQNIENYGASTPDFSVKLTDANNTSLHEETDFLFNPGRDTVGNVTCGGISVVYHGS
jgi:hypothetical protein